MKQSAIIILVTTKDKKQAKAMAKVLLDEHLIACANIVAGVESMFWWEGKIDLAKEVLLVLKTTKSAYKKVEARVKAVHSYQTPEIIALDIAQGSLAYLQWIGQNVR